MDVAVTQTGSGVTPVTAQGHTGLITTVSLNLAAANAGTFTVNNTAVDADSAVLVGICNYSGTTGFPTVRVNNCIAGTSFDIVVLNVHASVALNGVLKIGFMLL
jgi:FMN-dependent NADH-azoreductase